MLTEDQKRRISDLRFDPAYVSLMTHLEEEVAGMLGELEDTSDPREIMRLTRLWQIARKVSTCLKNAPEAIAAEFAKEKATLGAEVNYWGIADEDPFAPRPISPSYQTTLK